MVFLIRRMRSAPPKYRLAIRKILFKRSSKKLNSTNRRRISSSWRFADADAYHESLQNNRCSVYSGGYRRTVFMSMSGRRRIAKSYQEINVAGVLNTNFSRTGKRCTGLFCATRTASRLQIVSQQFRYTDCDPYAFKHPYSRHTTAW